MIFYGIERYNLLYMKTTMMNSEYAEYIMFRGRYLKGTSSSKQLKFYLKRF